MANLSDSTKTVGQHLEELEANFVNQPSNIKRQTMVMATVLGQGNSDGSNPSSAPSKMIVVKASAGGQVSYDLPTTAVSSTQSTEDILNTVSNAQQSVNSLMNQTLATLQAKLLSGEAVSDSIASVMQQLQMLDATTLDQPSSLPPEPTRPPVSTASSSQMPTVKGSKRVFPSQPTSAPTTKRSPGKGQKSKLLLPKPSLSAPNPLLPVQPVTQSRISSQLLPGNFSIPPHLQQILDNVQKSTIADQLTHPLSASDPPRLSTALPTNEGLAHALLSELPTSSGLEVQDEGMDISKSSLHTSSRLMGDAPSRPIVGLHCKPRRPCNCKASKCLKLYCDCFANGEFCRDSCHCVNCHNSMEHESDRAVAIQSTLERNPLAFHPKVAKHKSTDNQRRHIRGCHCKRSGCLKNYCECYEAKIPCSNLCKCQDCHNKPDSDKYMKSLYHLANVAESQSYTRNSACLLEEFERQTLKPVTKMSYGRKLPLAFVNTPVTEALLSCLLQVAASAEQHGKSDIEVEELVLEEYGSCLEQVIQAASNATTTPLES